MAIDQLLDAFRATVISSGNGNLMRVTIGFCSSIVREWIFTLPQKCRDMQTALTIMCGPSSLGRGQVVYSATSSSSCVENLFQHAWGTINDASIFLEGSVLGRCRHCSRNYEARGASGGKYEAGIVIFCILAAVDRFSWISRIAESH
jgi:hypothetical protein